VFIKGAMQRRSLVQPEPKSDDPLATTNEFESRSSGNQRVKLFIVTVLALLAASLFLLPISSTPETTTETSINTIEGVNNDQNIDPYAKFNVGSCMLYDPRLLYYKNFGQGNKTKPMWFASYPGESCVA
jgi:hypothetical protein